MPTSEQPSHEKPAEAEGAGADGQEVQGYMIIFCSRCFHNHKQTDPKCNPYCAHGASGQYSPGTGVGSLY